MEQHSYILVIFALLVVVTVISLAGLLFNKLRSRIARLTSSNVNNIMLEDSLFIDHKRRLVVVKCNKRRYVIMLGANNDFLVDSTDLEVTA
jgi:flagellar biogenesis protein FliO